MEKSTAQIYNEVLSSFKGDFNLSIEIKGKTFIIQREVFDLIHNISKERDNLRHLKK